MKTYLKLLLALFGFLLCFGSAHAVTININGDMSDWGISATTGFSTADSVDNPVIDYQNGVHFWEEDGLGNSGYVGPGYGGQDYDIEALYVTSDATNLYIGIITGFFPSGDNYMGDIAIDLDSDGVYEYGIDTSTGNFHSGLTSADWSVPVHFGSSTPVSIAAGNTGIPVNIPGSFYYGEMNLDGQNTDLYAIEVAVALTDLSWEGHGNFHITQWCGNDAGDLTVAPVPEPATVILLGIGLLGLAGYSRKRRDA